MHACSTSSCLSAKVVVHYSYVPAIKASPSDVEMARLVALPYGGESASVSGCLQKTRAPAQPLVSNSRQGSFFSRLAGTLG